MNEHLLEERIRAMGAELGTFCHHLEQEVDSLAVRWRECETLFSDDAQQIDLLNATASTFFYLIHQLMYQDAMLSLSRLTDPGIQQGHENLTIRRLPQLVAGEDLVPRLNESVLAACEACQFARAWRDKRLAHGDADVIIGRKTISPPHVTHDDVSGAIAAVARVLRLVSDSYATYSQTSSSVRPNPWGSRALVARLQSLNERDERSP